MATKPVGTVPAAEYQKLIGKRVVVAFKTTHIDRAGETGVQLAKYGEIVALEEPAVAMIDAEEGEHLRCPIAKLHRVPASESLGTPCEEMTRPDYCAAEELIRDFHSAKRPLVLRWLGRKSALDLCRTLTNT